MVRRCIVVSWGLSLAVAVGLAPGCSNGDTNDLSTDGSTGNLPDGDASNLVDAGNTLACQPADVSTFKPTTYKPALAVANACNLGQIAAFWDACLADSSSGATCDAFLGVDASLTNQTCAACLLSRASDPKYGPVIKYGNWQDLNVPGCMELTNAAALDCAKAMQAEGQCTDQACKDNCPVKAGDKASFTVYSQCRQAAASGGCANFDKAAQCQDNFNASGPTAVCFAGATLRDTYLAIAAIFCGPREAGAADAGASDGGPKDAASGG